VDGVSCNGWPYHINQSTMNNSFIKVKDLARSRESFNVNQLPYKYCMLTILQNRNLVSKVSCGTYRFHTRPHNRTIYELVSAARELQLGYSFKFLEDQGYNISKQC